MSFRVKEINRINMERLAKLTRRSRSFIVNEAMEVYMRDRIAYLEEIEEAMKEVHSGYGHSSEQIHAWMKSWGTENELPVPSPDIVPHK